MKNKILKIGHRGAKGFVAENTLESIQYALDLEVDGIEIDVHKCASGELVVFHDFTVDRLTNGSGSISKLSLKDIKKLKVLGQFHIPTLEEVLVLINAKCLLNIELKGSDTAKSTCKLIQQYITDGPWKYSDLIISSFQQQLLSEVHGINSNIPIGVLTDANLPQATTFGISIGAKAIHPDYTMLTKADVQKIQDLGFKVYTYTVNEKEAINRMKLYDVDGIISDFPDRI